MSILGSFGDVISSAVSVWNAEKNRDLQYDTVSRNLADNAENRAFQERMSNTAISVWFLIYQLNYEIQVS